MRSGDPSSHRLMLRLFGPPEVYVEGQSLPRLRSRKTLWLLALLVLRPGQEVARDWLAGTLWPESGESQGKDYLRHALTELRAVLRAEAPRLLSPTSRTLMLDLAGAEVDVFSFDRAMTATDNATLEHAVALYRGPLLEGCAETWVIQEREVREQAYLNLLERLAENALSEGAAGKAIGYLRRAVVADPLRESARRRLMEALAANGDYAAVVQDYRELRQVLQRELRSQPDPQTTAVFEQIRAKARRLAESPTPAPTVSIPRASENRTVPHNLPQQVTSFIGREKEIAEIQALLSKTRLLTLTGTGGCGKTRLALETVASLRATCSEGVWLVELAALSDPGMVVQTVATTLGVREETGLPLQTTLIDYLKDKNLLLLLDNCEHVLEASATLVDTVHRHCPDVRILITSREPLRVSGEITYRVPSLSLPDMSRIQTPQSLSHYEAVRLFVERATAVRGDFSVTRQNAMALASVCHRLDGIPLAIELAAARVRILSVEDIHGRLDQGLNLLKDGSRTVQHRQQTLRSLIDWSYALLNEREKQLFCRFSIFAGGWTLLAAERVCATLPEERYLRIEEWEILDLLTSLADKSLVVVEPSGTSVRYRLLETVRQYAWEKLGESGEREYIQARHQRVYREMVEEIEPRLKEAQASLYLKVLEADLDNLRVALEGPSRECTLRMATALWLFWHMRGSVDEGRRRLSEAVQEAGEGIDTTLRAKALYAAGELALQHGDYASARTHFEANLLLRREIGDQQGIALSLNKLGALAFEQGDFPGARRLHEESLEIQQKLEDKPGIASTFFSLGNVAYIQEDFVQAIALFEKSLALQREIGDRRTIALCLNNLGAMTYELGDFPRAKAIHGESLWIRRELGLKMGIAYSLQGLGSVAEAEGEYALAQNLFEESLGIRREIGDRRGIALSLDNLGSVAFELGDLDRARGLHEESLAIRRELRNKVGIAFCLHGLGNVACGQGDLTSARALYEESLTLRRQLKHKFGIALSLHRLGKLELHHGNYASAQTGFEESLILHQKLGTKVGIAQLLHAFGSLAAALGQTQTAATLWGASTARHEAIGSPVPLHEREAFHQETTRAAGLLGEDAFSTAWNLGLALTEEQAIRYTLERAKEFAACDPV